MKRTFKLEHPKIKVPRVVDSIKHDIKKYLKRERNKDLPADAMYWGFDCMVGESEATATEVHLSSLNKGIDELVANGNMTVYVEILAKPIEASSTGDISESHDSSELED